MSAAPPPSVALVAAVPAGATHDAPGRRGTAHLVEHLVARRCLDEHAWWSVNGLTGGRVTMFEAVVPAEHRSAAELALLRAVQQPLDVSDALVAAELEVVDVEVRGEGTSKDVVGPLDDRRAITAADVRAFHERYYRAGPPHLVAVGPRGTHRLPPAAGVPAFPVVGPEAVHVQEDCGVTQVVVALEGRDPAGTALLLDLAGRVDPQLPRVLTLPVVVGHRRTRPGTRAMPLTVAVRVSVEPAVTAIAVAITGGVDATDRWRWLRGRLTAQTPAPGYHFPDPLTQARWRAFWDLSLSGGWAALHLALTSTSVPAEQARRAVAHAVHRQQVTARV